MFSSRRTWDTQRTIHVRIRVRMLTFRTQGGLMFIVFCLGGGWACGARSGTCGCSQRNRNSDLVKELGFRV